MNTFLLFFTLLGYSHSNSSFADEVKIADETLNRHILKNEVAFASGFYRDEFILTTGSVKQKTKADVLSEIGSSDLKLQVNLTENVEVRVVGQTAVLTGILHQQGSYKEKSFDVKLWVTDTWVKTETGWKILAGHASLISKN
jgi:hypothetical protein